MFSRIGSISPRIFTKIASICEIQLIQRTMSKGVHSISASDAAKRLVWVDLEMSGLDINKEHILEIACIVTDQDLNVIAEGPNIIVNQSDEVLKAMGEWCTRTHTESGLVDAVKKSTISLAQAEEMTLEFVKKYCPAGKCPLAGNSVHADRIFLNKYMQTFLEHLHYRIVDVSTLKELAMRWYPELPVFHKRNTHRALDDIKESIAELKHYRQVIFR